jgi:hypothetical protein
MFSLDCLTSGAKSNILGYISLHPIPLVCSLKVVTHLVAFWMNGVSGLVAWVPWATGYGPII